MRCRGALSGPALLPATAHWASQAARAAAPSFAASRGGSEHPACAARSPPQEVGSQSAGREAGFWGSSPLLPFSKAKVLTDFNPFFSVPLSFSSTPPYQIWSCAVILTLLFIAW